MVFLVLSILSPLIPLTVGFKNRSTLLWLYPLTGLTFDLLISLLRRGLHVNYFWPGNLFVLLEFLIVSFLYRKIIFKNDKFFFTVIGVLSAFFIGSTITRSVFVFNVSSATHFTFAYIIYSLLGFYNLLKRHEIIFLEKSWLFWLNSAITIYASGNFLLFLFRDYLITLDEELFVSLWHTMFQILNITKNILIAIALYHYKPAPRESH